MRNNNIAVVRKFRDMTQDEAARAMGVSIGTYRNWEQGKNDPGRENLLKLRDLYRVTADQLLIPGYPLLGQVPATSENDLSDDEAELVSCYRSCAADAQGIIMQLARFAASTSR